MKYLLQLETAKEFTMSIDYKILLVLVLLINGYKL